MKPKMSIHDVVRRLTGPIDTVGDTGIDERALENLKEMTALIDTLVGDVASLACGASSRLHSVQQSGKHAKEFLASLRDAIDDGLSDA